MRVVLGTDREAAQLFSDSGADIDEPVDLFAMARRLMGRPPILGEGETRLEGPQLVVVPDAPNRMRWLSAVQLARWWISVRRSPHHDRSLAAAILAPLGQWRAAMEESGNDLEYLCESFQVSQSLALLRIGEAQTSFAAIKCQNGLIVISGQGAARRPKKLCRVEITDEPLPRVALVAA